MSIPEPKPAFEPANMLALPRELRQKILQYAFSDARQEDFRLNRVLDMIRHGDSAWLFRYCDCGLMTLDSVVAPRLFNLASVLVSTVPTIIDDIKSVLDKALVTLERQGIKLRF